MKYRITPAVIVALLAALALISSSHPPAIAQVADPRYYVSSVTLTGPSSLAPGGSATYSVASTVARNGAALNVGVDGTVELRMGNTVLASKTMTVLRNQNTATLTIPLQCTGGNIAGAAASSGTPNASVVAHINETDSAPLTVTCNSTATGGC
jgi:hypothetical protein